MRPPRPTLPDAWPLGLGCVVLGFAVLGLLTPSGSLAAQTGDEAALTIEVGSTAADQVVSIGRDVIVDGQALNDVAAVNGAVRITGSVVGDVIVLSGNATLGPQAKVGGDVYVLGGRIEAAQGASIGGRSVAYPSASAAWLTLLEAPALGLAPSSPVVLGAKLALLTAWLALVLVFFAAAGGPMLSTSEGVRAEPFRCFAVGVVGVIALLLTALFFSVLAAALVGIPLLALVGLFAVGLKIWGMVAVFHAFGLWLTGRVGWRVTPLNAAVIGLMVLGGVKLIPWVGLWTWHVATFIGVGASLLTKLGSRRPWFNPREVERLAA